MATTEDLLGVVRDHAESLDGEAGRELRKESASALRSLSEEKEILQSIEEAEDGIELIVLLFQYAESCRDALATLVNLTAWAHSEGERRMEAVVKRISLRNVAKVALDNENDWSSRDTALRLIQNATTLDIGCIALGPDLEMLLKQFVILPYAEMEEIDDRWARFGGTLQNASASSLTFRHALLRRSTSAVEKLIPHLRSASIERRRGVAAALKHCAIDREEHFYLFDELGAGAAVVNALAQPDDVYRLDNKERTRLESFAGDIIYRREPDPEVALLLLETLLCFCATRRIRLILKKASVYPVVRDCDLTFAGISTTNSPDSEESHAPGILVTTDPTPDNNDDNQNTDNDPSTTNTTKISRICADLADMLLREEAPEVEHTFAPPAASASTITKKEDSRDSNSASFSSLKAGFLSTPLSTPIVDDSAAAAEFVPKKKVFTDEEISATVDSFDLPD